MYLSTANTGTRAPRTFVETMGYVPKISNPFLSDRIKAAEIITRAMDNSRCSKCPQYMTGCPPGQVILCTKAFLDDIEKGVAKA